MRRKLFGFVAAVSLVIFLATAALWVRSYWTQDTLSKAEPGRFRGFVSQRGSLGCTMAVVSGDEVPNYSGWHWDRRVSPQYSRIHVHSMWNWLGFGTHTYKTNLSSGREYWLPDWFVVFAFLGFAIVGTGIPLVLSQRKTGAKPSPS